MTSSRNKLSWITKLVYGSGDFYGGASATVIAMLFLFFMTDVVGLRPLAAGFVVFMGRLIDAVTDPLMGRISDRTRSPYGRRSPYFLFASLPVGLSFGMLWIKAGPPESHLTVVYYTAAYILFSLAFTTVMVPYAALAPELTNDYHERTSLISFRMAFSILGALTAAVVPKTLIDRAPSLSQGYVQMGLVFGILFIFIWLNLFFYMKGRESAPVHRDEEKFVPALLSALKNKAFLSLIGIYLFAFIVNDILSTNFIYYLTYYLKKPDLYTVIMGSLLIVAVLSLSAYVSLTKRVGKRKTFMIGTAYWMLILSGLFLLSDTVSSTVVIVFAILLGIGTGVSYAIPWSMLPEVIELDQVVTGKRREGLYSGVMTFLRKLSSSVAVLAISFLLEVSGYISSTESASVEQPDSAILTIRLVISLLPLLCLSVALFSAWKFPIRFNNYHYIRMFLNSRENRDDPITGDKKKMMEENLSLMSGRKICLEENL
ncbi:MAG: glycoside-pentoside-hexuronide (GPH):cation symporter [Spirochaetales bacterium]|nr:glycoside-pentoside-hexuronide (GPH):cation symporter [Spirochaetales bacterium]